MPDTLRRFKADIFQALAHPTRVHIVELLRDGEQSAGSLIRLLGVEQANASQHLAVLRAKQVVVSRREGNQVFYAVRDPLLVEVLDALRRLFDGHADDARALLEAVKREGEEVEEATDEATDDDEEGEGGR